MVVEILFWVTDLKRLGPEFSMSRIHDRLWSTTRSGLVHDRLWSTTGSGVRDRLWSPTGSGPWPAPEKLDFGKEKLGKTVRFCNFGTLKTQKTMCFSAI